MMRFLLLCVSLPFICVLSLQIDSDLSLWQQGQILISQELDQSYEQIDWAYSRLPRLVMALLVGACMGLIGSVIQQLTRNPLLSPATLGSSSGAWLGLIILAVVWPEGQSQYQVFAAMLGACIALALVLMICGVRNLTGLSVVLSGMAVNLLFGAIAIALILMNDQYAKNLFIWGAGDLSQNGWEKVHWLWPHCLLGLAILGFAGKPLDLLKMGQSAASGRGLNVAALFLVLMLVGLWMLSAAITMVGIVGFLGLVAPNLARLIGARAAGKELYISTLLGAILLVVADSLALYLNTITFEVVPTGLTTAFLGAPLLIWLIQKRLSQQDKITYLTHYSKASFTSTKLLVSGLVLLVIVLLALLTHMDDGLNFRWPDEFAWPIRWPRIIASLAAGAGMAVSGVIMQRLIHNPLASPDLLGVSAGAVLALVATSGFLGWRIGELGPLVAFSGSFLILLILLVLGSRFRFAPAPMILTGVALSAFIETLVQGVLMKGTEEVYDILRWLAGSTYRVKPDQAWVLMLGVSVLILISLSLHRWLTLMSMGREVAVARGVNVKRAFILLLILSVSLCSLVTSILGPIAFVSIVAPHLASLLGARQVSTQILLSALLGAGFLQLADWLGQMVIYPNQLAAGTMAAIIGGVFFMLLLLRNRSVS